MNEPYSYNFDPDEDEDWIPLSETSDTAAVEREAEPEEIKLTSDESSSNNHSANQQDGVIPSHEYLNQLHVDNIHTIDTHFGPAFGSQNNNSVPSGSNGTINNSNSSSNNQSESGSKLSATLDTIRKRHERTSNLKETLTGRPLAILPKILFCHLMREFWNSNRFVRLGKFIFLYFSKLMVNRCIAASTNKQEKILFFFYKFLKLTFASIRHSFHSYWYMSTTIILRYFILL